jgi:hypothetical protein
MPGQLLNDFQYRRLRGLRKRLRLVKDFFSRAHSGNLNQSHPADKSRLWLDSQLSTLNLFVKCQNSLGSPAPTG